MALLHAQKVTKTFFMGDQSLTVLSDVTLAVQKGEFLAIAGRSGSGKSTLMNILGCLDVPTSGKYEIGAKDVSRMSADDLAQVRNVKVGFVFQQFNLLQDLTALDNVALPQLYAGKSEKTARIAAKKKLELVGLSDRMLHYPSQLSGGQQQRVATARGLVNDPEIILADEPTGNLDFETGAAIMNLFSELNRKQECTVIVVTHDTDLARKTRRIITLFDGRIASDEQVEGT